MHAQVTGIGAYVPEKRMSNDEIATIVDTSDEWIRSHTGIASRHIAAADEAASDLGAKAATQALADAGVPATEVDLILLATSTPDYPGLPSTACIVQDLIGAEHAAAMDLVAACSGFVYGLETARAYVESGLARTVLLIGSEVYSRIVNWKDRSTCVLFGDGAGAAVVQGGDGTGKGIRASYLRSRGSDSKSLYRPAGGSRTPLADGDTTDERCFLYMDGRRVYNFAVSVLVEIINTLLAKENLGIDDVDYIVPHQANIRIIDAAAKRGGFPKEKFFTNLQEFANTSAASIPIALDQMKRSGLIQTGSTIMTIGFGSGLTFGGNLITL